ncbi:lateral signaling target-like protein of unknown function [Perilla frutescens var. hirtella]|uniref:GTD-binding domain-containing protein n=1 Tax=Perilla frutescens var. hirtella TaxID=608512 RepID=A0AAD4P2X0_PERFH|nr:lateral signaling target-like protein of unknown function [Perilla frutescens var. hirtella]
MATEISCTRKKKPGGFTSVLSSAASEWFLMFLLFMDATFSYLLMKFARYCELEPPCMLCSRLDHGFGRKKPGFYWSLLCSDHREEISSLVSCSIHCKTANVRSLCEECLTSIAMQSSPDNMICSCCSQTLTSISYSQRLIELDPIGFGDSRGSIKPPLPRTPGSSRLCHRDSLRRVREKFIGPVTDQPSWRSRNSVGVDSMSNVAYTKLKFSSDSESEFAQSEDDDDGNTSDHDIQQSLDKPPSDQGFEERKPLALDPLPSAANTVHLADLDHVVCSLPETSESVVSLPHMPAISILSEVLSVCSLSPLSSDTTLKNQEATARTRSDDVRLSEKNDMHQVKASTCGDETLQPSDAKREDVVKVSSDSEGNNHRSHKKHEESRMDKDSRPVAAPTETKETSYEITVSDTEGESIIDQLKRQIEHDQNCLNDLYKDLEEERNASAIAAEEAMSMITRLQEEKAALRMEALHYLRMMEEQAAYDTQALEKANDLLAEREKEMQDLEYELESYRNNFPYEPEEDDDNRVASHTETSPGASSNSQS